MRLTRCIFAAAALLCAGALLLAWNTKPNDNSHSKPPPSPSKTAAKAPRPPSTPPPVTAGRVTLGAALSGERLLRGGSGEVFLDLSLAARPSHQRAPVNIALVIDRSGSMRGQKLFHAKQAARALLERLQDGDRLAVVTYGDDTTLLVPSTRVSAATRPGIRWAIDRIRARGQTFLSGGFVRGRLEVQRQRLQGFVNRVILISDGKANRGVRSIVDLSRLARAAQAAGVATTTMGVGLYFNEDLLTAMATHGAGHAYYIESSTALAGIFARELRTLVGAVASGTTVKLILEPGVELLEVYGYAHARRGREVTIKVPDVYGGQRRKLICKLRAPTARTGDRPLARVVLAFHDPLSGRDERVSTSARVGITGDRTEVARSKNSAVAARVEQVVVASTMREAMQAYGSGEVSRTRGLLQAQIDATVARNRRWRNARLNRLVGKMRRQLRRSRAAPRPASKPGRSLIKRGKYDAMDAYF